MRSFSIFLLSAAAFLSTGCASTPIREEGAHHAIIRPANIPVVTVTQYVAKKARLTMVGGGYVTNSITFADEPYQLTNEDPFFRGANSVVLKVQLFTNGEFVCDVTQAFTLDRHHSWDIMRAPARDGGGCYSEIVSGDPLESGYRILGGLIRVDTNRGGRGSRGGSGHPEWSTTGRPEWEE